MSQERVQRPAAGLLASTLTNEEKVAQIEPPKAGG